MKKALAILVIMTGMIFPLACADNNSSPTQPTTPPLSGGTTSTPTGTITPGTPTNTPTLAVGANTPTFTPTFAVAAPVFQGNYGTTAAPNGVSYDPGAQVLSVAESEIKVGGNVTMLQQFGVSGTNLTLNGEQNIIYQGYPTPDVTPPWQPQTIALNGPQGFVNPGNLSPGAWSAILDQTAGGAATLYTGDQVLWQIIGNNNYLMSFSTASYGGSLFNNPKGLAADGANGYVYVADTGNGYIDEFGPMSAPGFGPPAFHRWNGVAGVTFGGFVTSMIKTPYAVACDGAGNVWVGDTGQNPSVIQEFTSGGTTIIGAWPTISNCVVHGIAINPNTGNIYISDSGNNLVEIYSTTGTLLSEIADPHGPHEYNPFAPSCIAFAGPILYIGDINNDLINVFQ